MANHWHQHAAFQDMAAFASLDAIFALNGLLVSKAPISEVIRVELEGRAYYVKRYWRGGKGLRRWLGTPRIVCEYSNLQLFQSWQIPTPTIVAWGAQYRWGLFRRGALVSLELADCNDMASLAFEDHPLLKDKHWLSQLAEKIATYTRILHQHRFTHNDLKWRNMLVNSQGQVFFIDCPCGGFWSGWLLRYRIIKDLACMDKVARHKLSRTQRLRFYLEYLGRKRLLDADKKQLHRVLHFFDGRA